MRATVEAFMREYRMAEPGDRILAAVSGGADSVCMVHLLAGMRARAGFSLRAMHIHHGLRGAEADRDAEFTVRLCEELGIPVKTVYADVRGYAKEHSVSEEEAGRILRYESLEREARAWEAEGAGCGKDETADRLRWKKECEEEERWEMRTPVKIAAAHHGDDSAETILHNLFRGTGLDGLGGIRPVRGRIIRPLLCVGRREILEYLREQGLEFCEDATNTTCDYTRNRIRNQVIPLIEAEVNPRAAEHIRRAGERVLEAQDFLEAAAGRWLEENGGVSLEQEEVIRIPDRLAAEPRILQVYVLRLGLERFSGALRDVTARHYDALTDLLSGPVGRKAYLPDGIQAEREYRALALFCGDREAKKPPAEAPSLEFTVFSREKNQEIPKNMYTKWFDYDKINNVLSVRTRRTGDYLTLASGGRKSVKAYMIDEKIPASDRDSIYLLADGSHILWVIGRRISEYYKIGPQTKTILQVQMNGGETHGR